jgi:hypothetical protein
MRTILLAALLTACADDVDAIDYGAVADFEPIAADAVAPPPRPGPAVVLELAVSAIYANAGAQLSARTAPAGLTIYFAGSTAGGGLTCPPQLGGMACVDLASPFLLGRARADATGLAAHTFTAPANVPLGATLGVQAIGVDANGQIYLSPVETITTGPVPCPRIYMPECGVDGVTYSNSCELEAGGTFFAYAGPC